MKSSKTKRGGAEAPERWFVPIHQDHVLEALATGSVQLRGKSIVPLGKVDPRLLAPGAHGLGYGVVGLLELKGGNGPESRGREPPYALLNECVAVWLSSRQELDELEMRAETFGDTVPGGLPLRHDGGLFAKALGEANEQLELVGPSAEEGGPDDPSPSPLPLAPGHEPTGPLLAEKIAGGISMLRHRALELGLDLTQLGQMLQPVGTGATGRVEGLVAGVLGHVGQRASPADARVVGTAAEMLARMDPSNGISPEDFAAGLAAEVAGKFAGGAEIQAADSLLDTVRRLLANQLELTAGKIDDSGQVGLRALVIFLLAPDPERLKRWISARPEIGAGVSLVASLLSGVLAGQGRLPAEVKGPGKEAFFSSTLLGHYVAHGLGALTLLSEWKMDGSRFQRVLVDGMEFAQATKAATPGVKRFLEMARAQDLEPAVDPASGALSLPLNIKQGLMIEVEIRSSQWSLSSRDVAALCVRTRTSGRGLTKPVLEQFLSPAIPPAWVSLGEGPGEVDLRIECSLSEKGNLRGAIECLRGRMEELNLQPAQARTAPAKRSKKTPAAAQRPGESPDEA